MTLRTYAKIQKGINFSWDMIINNLTCEIASYYTIPHHTLYAQNL